MMCLSFIYWNDQLKKVKVYRREGIAKRERTKLSHYGFIRVVIVPAQPIESLLPLLSSKTPLAPHLALKELSQVVQLAKPNPGVCLYCGSQEEAAA